MRVAFTDIYFNPFKCNVEHILEPHKSSGFYFLGAKEYPVYEIKKIECKKSKRIENNYIYVIDFVDLNDFLSFCFRFNKAAIQRYLRPIYDINGDIVELDAFMYFIPESFT
jgi:hypothetical protein